MADPVGVIRRAQPAPLGEGVKIFPGDQRLSRYAEAVMQPSYVKGYGVADEGAHFVAGNPTPGTGLATIATLTAVVDTSPFLLIQNAEPAGGKRYYLDYLKLEVTAPGTAGTAINYAVKVDSRTNPWTSGGSTLTPVNPNMDVGNLSNAFIKAGALVAAAASANARLLGHGGLRPVIPVIADTYVITFGGVDFPLASLAVAGTAVSNVVKNHVPVIIGPGQTAFVHLWLPSQSAASSYEVELAWWER